MKISRSFALYMVMVCLILLGAASAWSQTNFSIKIYAEDGSGWKDSVQIGKYTNATDAIGDSISPTLVENELPPVPPSGGNQAPDLRLIDPLGGGAYGQGVGCDLRLLVSDGQSNTYRLSFRRSDPEGTSITLSWPSGLGAVSGGGFFLTDGFSGFFFSQVDMAAQTSFALPGSYNGLSGGFVDIVVGAGALMRTFTSTQIATAADQKGKVGKFEKRKPISVDFQITLNAPDSADLLYIEFDKIVEGTVSFSGDPDSHPSQNFPGGLKKYTINIPDPPLNDAALVVINGNGNKGKVMKGKYYFGKDLVNGAKTPFVTDYDYLRMPMPNINNIGDELYLQSVNLGVGVATSLGLNAKLKPIIHHISLPKWKDVTKTLYKFKNVTILQGDGPAECLDTIKSKENIKMLKSLAPDKSVRVKDDPNVGNKLIAELIALKFNIAASAKLKTPAQGFGELIYVGPDALWNGMTVNEIAAASDSALACVRSGITRTGAYTYATLADFLETLNAEFSGPFDTLSFGGPGDGKPLGGTQATGISAVALSDIFISGGGTYAPVAEGDFSSLYDVPLTFSLSQNYPNPFNPTTMIEFSIPEDGIVTLQVYNMLGQVVATLADREEFSAGENWVELDGAKLATGVYYYRIMVNDGQFQEIRKMVLMK